MEKGGFQKYKLKAMLISLKSVSHPSISAVYFALQKGNQFKITQVDRYVEKNLGKQLQ